MLAYFMPMSTIALSLNANTDKLALLALKEKLTNGVPDYLPSWNESLLSVSGKGLHVVVVTRESLSCIWKIKHSVALLDHPWEI